jgi:uncharacterized protein (DUF1778 family)
VKESANTERVDIRLPRPLKERIRKIATQTGRSMSDFIIAAVLEKADETMASIERWELSEEDSRFVVDLLIQRRDTHGLSELLALTDPKTARVPTTT